MNFADMFEDNTQWCKDHPGNIEYTCEFCGLYTAGAPHCNKCEATPTDARQKAETERWLFISKRCEELGISPMIQENFDKAAAEWAFANCFPAGNLQTETGAI